jgi:hypothetical protein
MLGLPLGLAPHARPSSGLASKPKAKRKADVVEPYGAGSARRADRFDWTRYEIVLEAVRCGLLIALIVPWVVGVTMIAIWFWGIL